MLHAETNRNEHKEFVGLENLIAKNKEQVEQFEVWVEQKDWAAFHSNHYDWWMFPIDQPSRLGFAYTIFESEIERLIENKRFIENLKKGTELLLLSWGWDLYQEERIQKTDKDQCWHDWPIRLYKCAQCLKLFGLEKELHSVKKFGNFLLKEKKSFNFRGKDLSEPFINLK